MVQRSRATQRSVSFCSFFSVSSLVESLSVSSSAMREEGLPDSPVTVAVELDVLLGHSPVDLSSTEQRESRADVLWPRITCLCFHASLLLDRCLSQLLSSYTDSLPRGTLCSLCFFLIQQKSSGRCELLSYSDGTCDSTMECTVYHFQDGIHSYALSVIANDLLFVRILCQSTHKLAQINVKFMQQYAILIFSCHLLLSTSMMHLITTSGSALKIRVSECWSRISLAF